MKPSREIDFLHVLFPHVRAEILRILFFDPTRETYGREAARATTLALRTVQRELLILEAAGLLTSRRKGPQRLFRAKRGHRIFPALQQLVINGTSDEPFVSKAKKPRQSWRHSARVHRRRSIRGSPLPKPCGVSLSRAGKKVDNLLFYIRLLKAVRHVTGAGACAVGWGTPPHKK
jgi:predicted transcriptional regulator